MDNANRDGEFYRQLHKLLKQYLYQSGIPYLKLEIKMSSSPLGEKLQNITLKVPPLPNTTAGQTIIKEDYRFRIELNLLYRGLSIGVIYLDFPDSDFPNSRIYEVFEPLSNQVVRLLSRNQLAKESSRLFGKTLSWLGQSLSMLGHEKNLDTLAEVEKCVVVLGDPSSGKLIAGLSFHIFSQRRNGPFVTTNCADWKVEGYIDLLSKLLEQAQGGTIYFRYFDCLNLDLRKEVITRIKRKGCGAVFSCNYQKERDAKTSMFRLYPDLVIIKVPSLNERKADIQELGEHILDEFGKTNQVKITKRGWSYLEQLNWRNGIDQLEMVMFTLLKRSQKSILDYRLLTSLIPKIDHTLQANINIRRKLTVQSIAEKVACDALLDLSGEHLAIQKAVTYIAANYQCNFELKVVARHACVSSSHLSFLLRNHLNSSYKQILNQCRIEKAKKLLIVSPAIQITEISARLGYCDLSHFEKTFRKKVGESPKQYKRRNTSLSEKKLLLFKKADEG